MIAHAEQTGMTDVNLDLTEACCDGARFLTFFRFFGEEAIRRRSPLRRWVEPDEIAQAVCFLLENDAAVGATLTVSAGTSMY